MAAWPKITSISTDPKIMDGKLEGSVYGGTKLAIRGNNFDAGNSDNTRIYVGIKPCKIIEFRVDDSYIQCFTPPADD
jgi:hypothetical protein